MSMVQQQEAKLSPTARDELGRSMACDLNRLGVDMFHCEDNTEALDMFQEAYESLEDVVARSESSSVNDAVRSGGGSYSPFNSPIPHRDTEGNTHMGHLDGGNRTRMLTEPLDMLPPSAWEGTVKEEIRRSTTDKYNLSVLSYNMGLVYHKQGSNNRAAHFFNCALKTCPQKESREIPHIAVVPQAAANNLGHIEHSIHGKKEGAVVHFSRALDLVERAVNQLNNKHGAAPQSISSSQRDVLRRHFSTIVTNHSLALFTIGETCERGGMLDEAMTVYVRIIKTRKVMQLKQRYLRREQDCRSSFTERYASFVYSLVMYRMGNIHYGRRDYHRALQAFQFSLALRQEANGREAPATLDIASLLHDIGLVQLELTLIPQAMKSFEECLRLRRFLLGDHHREVAEILYRIGRLQQDEGQYENALQAFTEALKVEQIVLGREHPDVAITLTNIAQIHYLRGDLELALGSYQEVLRVVRLSLGSDHPSIVEIQNTIGTVELNRGRSREAAAAFAEARRIECMTSHASYHFSNIQRNADDNQSMTTENEMSADPSDVCSCTVVVGIDDEGPNISNQHGAAAA